MTGPNPPAHGPDGRGDVDPFEPASRAGVGVDPDAPIELSFAYWYRQAVPRLGTVARCYLPGASVDRRRRELVAVLVGHAVGDPAIVAFHEAWQRLLGPAELTDVDDDVVDWVIGVSFDGHLDDGSSLVGLDDAARATVLALVSHTMASAAALQRGRSLVDRVTGDRPRHLRSMFGDAVGALVGLPLVVPTAVAGAAAGVLDRLAPDRPVLEVPDDANLLTAMLADVLPVWLGSAWGRMFVAKLPVEIPVGIRSGASLATVRIGRGGVRLNNGIDDDVWALFDGEVDALLQAGARSLSRQLRQADAPF